MPSTRNATVACTILASMLGAFFAARIATTLVGARWLGLDPQLCAAAQILLGVGICALFCFHSLDASFPWRVALGRPAIRWVLLYLLFSLLSFSWSGAVSLGSSLVYWMALAIDVATTVLLFRGSDGQVRSEALLRGYIYATCVLAVIAWCMPVQEDLRLGDGDYFNTNQIGNLCAFAFFFVQYLERRGSSRWPVAKVILLATLLRSLSKTTLLAMIVSQTVLFLRDDSVSRGQKARTICGVVLVCMLFSGLFSTYLDIYTTTGNQAETLTGRTAIWAFSLDAALSRPWLGNGFDALWHVMPAFGPDRFEARHAENELLQQFFAYGVAGIVLLAGIYGSVFVQIRRVQERPQRLLLLSLLIYVLVRGVAEAEPFDLLLPLWSIVLLSEMTGEKAYRLQLRASARREPDQANAAKDGLQRLNPAPAEE